MTTRFNKVFTALAVVAAAGCSSATAGANKVDSATLWKDATAKLAEKKWVQAQQMFERFTLEFPSDPHYQEARFDVGMAHMGAKEYITAATEFGRFVADMPSSPLADDAQMKVCEAYTHLSPEIDLDQQYTQAAIDQCQVVVAYFPSSELVPKATQVVAEMTDKLAHKLYATGDYYVHRHSYDSGLLYYDLTVKTYPLSGWAPKALGRMIDVYKILDYDTEQAATRARLLKDYPDSPEAKLLPDSVGKR